MVPGFEHLSIVSEADPGPISFLPSGQVPVNMDMTYRLQQKLGLLTLLTLHLLGQGTLKTNRHCSSFSRSDLLRHLYEHHLGWYASPCSELMRDGTQRLQGLGFSVPTAHVQGHNCSPILASPTGEGILLVGDEFVPRTLRDRLTHPPTPPPFFLHSPYGDSGHVLGTQILAGSALYYQGLRPWHLALSYPVYNPTT